MGIGGLHAGAAGGAPMNWCWWDCGDRLTYSQGKWQEVVVTAIGGALVLIGSWVWNRWLSDRWWRWRLDRRWRKMHADIDREPPG
jgi:hypothetical protein